MILSNSSTVFLERYMWWIKKNPECNIMVREFMISTFVRNDSVLAKEEGTSKRKSELQRACYMCLLYHFCFQCIYGSPTLHQLFFVLEIIIIRLMTAHQNVQFLLSLSFFSLNLCCMMEYYFLRFICKRL